MKKVLLTFLVLVLLTGCVFKDEIAGVQIIDSGWSYVVSDSGGFVSYGVEIKNFSDLIIKSPIIKVIGYDEDSNNIFEYTEKLSYIYSLDTIYFGKTFKVDDDIKKLDILLEIDDNNYINKDNENYSSTSSLEIKSITENDEYSYKEYNCTIANNGNLYITKPMISIVYKKDNKIVGGSYSYVTSLDVNEVKDFVLYTSNYPEYDNFDVNVLFDDV